MALRRFDAAESLSSGLLPFAKDFIEKYPSLEGNSYEVLSVKETQNRGGYYVKTDKFAVLLWKKKPLTEMIIEALEYYVNEAQGYALMFTLEHDTELGGSFGIDDEKTRMWILNEKKRLYQWVDETSDTPSVTSNPFLIRSTSPLSSSSQPTQQKSTRTRQKQNPPVMPYNLL